MRIPWELYETRRSLRSTGRENWAVGGMGSEQALRLSPLLFSSGFPHLPRYERTNVHALSPTSGARADGDEPWEEKRASPGHPDGEQGGLGEMQAGAR